jgi:uncharacterized protein (TIGR02452 family)
VDGQVPRISREQAAEYGEHAVLIIEQGYYTAPSGARVELAGWIESSVRGTRSYPPGETLPGSFTGQFQTQVEVVNETTLSAGRRLLTAGHRPALLNFASATHPGGGFLTGARAQEEYLARSSALYACLREDAMYEFHRARHDPLYTDYVLYSPDVPVFRADDGSLLEEPYCVAMITSPAVNADALLWHQPRRRAEIGPAMWTRILKVLAAGARHGHDAMVLGAWGCGAFGNDPAEIAGLFRQALDVNFRSAFARVVFAVLDWSAGERTIGPFREAFGAGR